MKKVFITGGCKGIGKAITEKFYENGFLTYAGFNASSDEARLMKEKMPGLTTLKIDVSDSSSVKEAFNATGGCDILINNAGIAKSNLITDVSDEEFDKIMKTDLYGTFYTCRDFLPYMIKKGDGVIINISSIWGMAGASMESSYSAAKAGVIGITKSLAKEVGPSKIRVNAIAPGFIETDMNNNLSYEEKAAFFEETPLMRPGTAKEIADIVFFLSSDSASFITGQVISPNGGIVI